MALPALASAAAQGMGAAERGLASRSQLEAPLHSPLRFFPSMVYLSSSKFSLAVLGNLGFATALATYKVLLRVRGSSGGWQWQRQLPALH